MKINVFEVPFEVPDEVPPWVKAKRKRDEVRAYFENRYGEQWVISARPNRLLLTGGDIDWKVKDIKSPDYSLLAQACQAPKVGFIPASALFLDGLIFSREEDVWLRSVCLAMVKAQTHAS